jgi:hypothetical protein
MLVCIYKQWSSELLGYVVFWLYTSISEELAASISKVNLPLKMDYNLKLINNFKYSVRIVSHQPLTLLKLFVCVVYGQ